MREYPLLCDDSVVRAILSGAQTQDRRPVKPQPGGGCLLTGPNQWGNWEPITGRTDIDEDAGEIAGQDEWVSPSGVAGDRLWVRECWSPCFCDGTECERRDGCVMRSPACHRATHAGPDPLRWRPSIHMPRRVCRIMLEVLRVWVERVQDISNEDAVAEGIPNDCRTYQDDAPRMLFAHLWDSLYAARGLGWDANPWVWACEFRMVKP